jgi:transposase
MKSNTLKATKVYQIDQGIIRLLWVGRERTKASFRQFFTLMGKELAAQIQFVCSDMWQPYLDVIRHNCSQALHILDRFHVVAKMNKALDEVRAAESRKMAQDGHEPLLKKSRWCVLKRQENLTSQRKIRLRDLLRYNLQTVRAYLLKEDFQQFWDYNSPAWAGKFLDFWCFQTMRSRIEAMKKIARMLRTHRALPLNYFKARKQYSSGVIEGLNNKAKVTMRKSYGFRTFRILELVLYHIIHLANCPNRSLPTNSSDESKSESLSEYESKNPNRVQAGWSFSAAGLYRKKVAKISFSLGVCSPALKHARESSAEYAIPPSS